MGEASPSGVAPRSPWRARTVTRPASPRTSSRARHAHCPDPPARDGRGARAARTCTPHCPHAPSSCVLHTLMHTARHPEHAAHAAAHRRVEHPTAHPSSARATQTRPPARGAARREQRRAMPTPHASFPSLPRDEPAANSATQLTFGFFFKPRVRRP